MKKLIIGIVILIVIVLLMKNRSNQSISEPTSIAPIASSTTEESTQKIITATPATYTVRKGEGLWGIAERELGDAQKWEEIATANNLKKPYVLFVGQELKIPGRETEVVPEVADTPKTITLDEIAQHSEKDNCWLAIEGKAYDVTPFIAGGIHPGKLMILMGCGKDATTLFNARPNTGTPHSSRAREMLPKYYIGDLAK